LTGRKPHHRGAAPRASPVRTGEPSAAAARGRTVQCADDQVDQVHGIGPRWVIRPALSGETLLSAESVPGKTLTAIDSCGKKASLLGNDID
jgi:hypothetical protein